ncbi:hypothetical protein D3C72_1930260 [compost metagenome]
MRMLATEGTKISTSASMTKTIVSSSSLPESPRKMPATARGASLTVVGCASSLIVPKIPCPSAEIPQGPDGGSHDGILRQGRIIGDDRLFSNLGKGRIGCDIAADLLERHAVGDHERPHADQLARTGGGNPDSKDASTAADDDLDQTGFDPVRTSAIAQG